MKEKLPLVHTEPYISQNGNPIVFVRNNSHMVLLECPGILVSRVTLPLDYKKREEFARTVRRRAKRINSWMARNGNSELNPELKERLRLITLGKTKNPLKLFEFVSTQTKKDFDTAVDLI